MTALSRRTLLAASAGLVVAFRLPAHAADKLPGSLATAPSLDAWIRVAPDGRVTILTGKCEIGQGIRTALLQVAAEQLRLPPAALTLITADTFLTANEGYTSGSHSTPDSATAILHAAAQVRTLLEQQAAKDFAVDPATLRTENGAITAPDGRTATYGALAAKLDLHVQAQPTSDLGDPATYKIIGTPLPRANIPPMVTGGPAFIQDMRPPGMLHARIIRQPNPAAHLVSIPDAPAGTQLIRRGNFLAVVGEREWTVVKAHRALSASAKWEGANTFPDPDALPDLLRALPARDMIVQDQTGAAAPAARTVKARYTKPYTMHGSIGPSCALAKFDNGDLTVWSHAQGMFPLRAALTSLLAMPQSLVSLVGGQPKIRCIHVPGSGCYGHNGADDAAGDAALVALALPGKTIRVQWMREDEHVHEPYGPAMLAEVEASLDASGKIVAWDYGVWSNTHSTRPNVGGLMLQNAALPDPLPIPDPTPIPMPEGGGDRNSIPIYAIPTQKVVSHFIPKMPLRVSALRSLGAYLNVFAIESAIDELAQAADADPVAFRLAHLEDDRAKAVIQLAAEKFDWPNRPKGSGFAFARYKNLAAYCAIALHLTVDPDTSRVRLRRVVAAVDSGQPINPDGIRNQIEGAIVQSASWTLYEQVHFDRDHIRSTDWSGYPIMRFPALPESVEVHIIPRPGAPYLGTGEAGQGPTAAAIANAIAHATGRRLRDLPLTPGAIARA